MNPTADSAACIVSSLYYDKGSYLHHTKMAPFIMSSRPLSYLIIIIIMYIYHALINALSAHMIHINLNMIFYTHVKHSPTKTIYIEYYKNIKIKNALQTHTHTHTHTQIH